MQIVLEKDDLMTSPNFNDIEKNQTANFGFKMITINKD